jgi:uncharacterized protein YceK
MNCVWTRPGANLPDVHGGQVLIMKRVVVIGVLSFALSGCGTAMTVFQGDADAASSLRKQKTNCQSIPRVYSGLAYDFCALNAPPDPSGFLVPFVLLDLPLSGVLDTLSLPYTLYRQVTEGSLKIYWNRP